MLVVETKEFPTFIVLNFSIFYLDSSGQKITSALDFESSDIR